MAPRRAQPAANDYVERHLIAPGSNPAAVLWPASYPPNNLPSFNPRFCFDAFCDAYADFD
jgi:hypothetical protein